jgi:type VI secretion system secreted protein VgrG
MNSGGGPGKGTGIGILPPVIPWAADKHKAGNVLDLALTNALHQLTATRLTAGMAPLCGKQSNGACSREDCPCLKG